MSNADLMRRLYAALNERDYDVIDEIMSDDYVQHGPMGDIGRADFRQAVEMWLSAMPDARIELEVLFEAGDRVGIVEHVTGTHTGEMMGIPPSGNRVDLQIASIGRIRDGRAVEHWSDQSLFQFMSQIGAIPMPVG